MEDEKSLIKRAKRQDEAAFRTLVERYIDAVERFIYQFGIPRSDIADMTQEVWVKVYQNIHRFKKGKFTTWLYPIALNTARDHHRKRKRERDKWNKYHHELVHRTHGPQNTDPVHESLLEMKETYRVPLILYYFHDHSYEEIGDILKLSQGTVKTRLHRGKEKLKHLIQEKEASDHG
ncbi:RNA polymerase sigma factor [Halobacillus fulvus]|nr:RNA polymerase sigma factor [Halobacillus fulvus]